MNIGFDHPWLLGLAAFAAAVSLLFRRRLGYYRAGRRWTIAFLRALSLVALAAIAGGLMPHVREGINLVVLSDVSASMEGRRGQARDDLVARVTGEMRGRGPLSVIAFAGSTVELLDAASTVMADKREMRRPEATDLETVLESAMQLVRPDSANRVLLLSDGNENNGRARRVLPELQKRGVQVLAYDFSRLPNPEVEVRNLSAPLRALVGQLFELKGKVRSYPSSRVRVTLSRDGTTLEEREITLDASGDGEAVFTRQEERLGVTAFRFSAAGGEGDHTENNSREAEVVIEGVGRTALITEDPESSAWLVSALRDAASSLDVITPDQASLEWMKIAESDLVLLDNVAAASLGAEIMERLERRVREEGTGLLVVGGNRGFGAGGYRETTLEKMLPVSLDVPDKGPEKEISLVIILDKSLSMFFRSPNQSVLSGDGPRKIDVAKGAIMEILRVLRPQDHIGILLSGDALEWLKKPGPLGAERAALERGLLEVRAFGGGIYFYSSLLEAQKMLIETRTPIRHIMVVCDARDIDQYEVLNQGRSLDLVRGMVQKGITLSIFSIGRPSDKDVEFLRAAAGMGKGDFYLVSETVYLPRYFVSDYKRKKDEWVRDETFQPLVKDYSPLLQGISPENGPLLSGLDLTAPREGAEDALITPFGLPLLASWKYGRGRVTAFTADSGERWSRHWKNWPQGPSFWRQVSYVTAAVRKDDRRMEVQAQVNRSEGYISFLVRDPDEKLAAPGTRTVTLEREGKKVILPLERVGFQEYRAQLPPLVPGIHRYVVTAGNNDAAGGNVALSGPAEYDLELPGGGVLDTLVKGTGGFWVDQPADVLRDLPPVRGKPPDFIFWLLFLAMTALLTEFILRY